METYNLYNVVEKVIQELRNMPEDVFKKKLEIHMVGDIAQILIEVDYFKNNSIEIKRTVME